MNESSPLRKPTDGIVSRWMNRPLSLAITRRLANTRVMPNQISIFTMLLGLSSGLFVMQGGYWMGLGGAFLLQVQSVLDGVDGELARLRSQTSKLGQWLDTVSDDLSEFSFLIGLTLIAPLPWLRWLSVAGVVSVLITKSLIYHSLITVHHSGDLLAFDWQRGPKREQLWQHLRFLDKHDFVCLLSLFLALIGRIEIATVYLSLRALLECASLLKQIGGRTER